MYWALILVLFFIDIYSKVIAERRLKYSPREYFSGRLQLYYVRNFGIALNKLNNKKNFILICNFLLLIFIGYLMVFDTENYFMRFTPANKLGLALVMAGGLGNTLNRMVKGYVIDFIYFNIKKFPVFNLADFYIFIGVGILLAEEII